MKSLQQIQNKIDEARLFENECELMAECIDMKQHPSEIYYKWKTFNDLNAAYKLDSDAWMDKAELYLKMAEALEWVIKD